MYQEIGRRDFLRLAGLGGIGYLVDRQLNGQTQERGSEFLNIISTTYDQHRQQVFFSDSFKSSGKLKFDAYDSNGGKN